MFKKAKLWQLYIFPFLVVILILAGEKGKFALEALQSFEDIAQNTQALGEVDVRNFEKAHVTKVIDGDTIEIETGEHVRFIGVDTPETVHPKKSVQCYGRDASNKTKALLEGKDIYLEKDVSETDRYKRLLRYIYLPNPDAPEETIFINEYLVEQGYGVVITYPPDVKYHKHFLEVQRVAQDEQRGLWGKCKT
ncbi:hypothetical protein CO051_00895 [Candidatus Roizmanbacteria bacterium CG_4_9_14_0_2_um_filter_39_13]|uniref:TNase-like domain-containing protein n=2 Tax=Candidatus Roizmaniibacteriota TaxID=1752723 RepID=A0A2M8F3I7_9BACT|nr:MAG: hypothetical protein COY15_05270 [Candidatus Roizmanbacteria bacterium CG_4_10_14_0_2_um_filter_39_12]PJC33845.1 MAG: hypothetical protein CO051_00895 [Candidatus Roizmanbacteria bacterium CG_4_9_14_0_2_um_filter_39_13]PJE61724.1 MAG: hypothetical protein COU87_03025 [Candidatus Roizmanbacteria bacterium CG10_big_fil_rev_8_21_14_0_10_39_12]